MRFLPITLLGAMLILSACCGTRETRALRAQAQSGQSIVQAIEDFQKQTGSYPTSLYDLAPKYLPTAPQELDELHPKSGDWDYSVVTKSGKTSYSLRCYMERGAVEYAPPNWIGIYEGHKTVVLRDQ